MAEKIIALPQSCAAWGSEAFPRVLKHELEAQSVHDLPLQAGLTHSSVVADEAFTVFPRRGVDDCGRVVVDVQYAGLVAGCNCSDDPSVVESRIETCALSLRLWPDEGRAAVSVLPDLT